MNKRRIHNTAINKQMNKQTEKKEKNFLINRMPTTNAEGKMDSENHSDNHDSN